MNTINRWYGGFGNNILQLANGLTYSFFRKCGFSSPSHPLIKPIKIEFGPNSAESDTYFYLNLSEYGPIGEVLKIRESLVKEIVSSSLILPELSIEIEKKIKNEKNLIVHIRGGDVFQPHHVPVHSAYVQAPLRYYEFISQKYESIYIINQDDKNPVFSALKKKLKFKVLSAELQHDVAVLINSANLSVGGTGTFLLSCALCSNSIKKIYLPGFVEKFWEKNFARTEALISVDLPNYIEPGQWVGDDRQKEILLTY